MTQSEKSHSLFAGIGQDLTDKKERLGRHIGSASDIIPSIGAALEFGANKALTVAEKIPTWTQSLGFGATAWATTGNVTATFLTVTATLAPKAVEIGVEALDSFLGENDEGTAEPEFRLRTRRISARIGTAIVGGLLAARLLFGAFTDNGKDATSTPVNQPTTKAQTSLTIN